MAEVMDTQLEVITVLARELGTEVPEAPETWEEASTIIRELVLRLNPTPKPDRGILYL